MKLVRLTHIRCAEYDAATFVLAPDDWDEDRIQQAVGNAQDAYFAAYEQALKDDPPPPRPTAYGSRFYERHPDKTVAEVKAMLDAMRAARSEWDKRQAATRRHFADFLRDQGFETLWGYEGDDLAKVRVDWGHRHGQRLAYRETETDTFSTPAKLAGTDDEDDVRRRT